MTTTWTAAAGLINEIRNRIEALTPNAWDTDRFKYRTTDLSELSEISEETGKPRLFQIDLQPPEKYRYVGGGTVGYETDWQLRIVYPTSKSWPVAMMDDIQLIRNDLITNPTSVTGIGARWLNLENPPEPTEIGDGWTFLSIPIYVLFNSTAT